MPLFNVEVTIATTLVVEAADANDAYFVAKDSIQQAIKDAPPQTDIFVRGQVSSEQDLSAGWDGDCLPYGGDGNTRLRELLVDPA